MNNPRDNVNNPPHQPFDTTFKGILDKHAVGIFTYLVPGLAWRGNPPGAGLNVKINRTILTADRVFNIYYNDVETILNPEVQVKADTAFLRRQFAYHAHLHMQYKKPVLSVTIYPFEEGSEEDTCYTEMCGKEVMATIHRKVICLRNLDTEKIVREHQLALYPFLVCTNRPTFPLVKHSLQRMHEMYDHEDFKDYMKWFVTLLERTKTMHADDKEAIRGVLKMQYQIDNLLREDPTIIALVDEGKIQGKIEGLNEAILGLIASILPIRILNQVRQTIASTHDVEQLRKFHNQVAKATDEQEVATLLDQCFPAQAEIRGEIKGIQNSILSIARARFSPQIVSAVEQAIAPVQDREQLNRILHQLALTPDEQAVAALLAQHFPPQRKEDEEICERLRESIKALINARFSSPALVLAVQQAIDPIQDPEQLKAFLYQLALVPDEMGVYALLTQSFPS